MYKITKQENHIVEDLQICRKGQEDPALVIHIDLDMDTVGDDIRKSFERLGIAQVALGKDPATAENYGQAVIAFFSAVFGADQCRQLLDFYASNYTEMLLDIFPFLDTEILPKIREHTQTRKQQMLAAIAKTKAKSKRGWPF